MGILDYLDEDAYEAFKRKQKERKLQAPAPAPDPAWRAATQPASVYEEFPEATRPAPIVPPVSPAWVAATRPEPELTPFQRAAREPMPYNVQRPDRPAYEMTAQAPRPMPEGEQPASTLGDVAWRTLERLDRPRQALLGAYAADAKTGGVPAMLEGAKRGLLGEQHISGYDAVKAQGGLPLEGLIGAENTDTLNQVLGMGTDVLIDPIAAKGALASRGAGKAARAVDDVVRNSEAQRVARQLVPGTTTQAAEQAPRVAASIPLGVAPETGAGVLGATTAYDPDKPMSEQDFGEMAKRGLAGAAGMRGVRAAVPVVASRGKVGPFGGKLGAVAGMGDEAAAVLPDTPLMKAAIPEAQVGRAGQVADLPSRELGERASLDTVSSATAETKLAGLPEETAPLNISKYEMEQGALDRQSSGPPPPPIKIGNTTIVPPPDGPPPIEVNPSRGKAVFSQFWNRARNVIESQGPAGKQLGRMLQDTRNQAETMAGRWVLDMPTVRALKKEEFGNFVDTAEGAAQPANDRIARAVGEWTKARDSIYTAAKKAGLDTGYLEDYFPHRYDPKMFEGDNWKKAVEHLISTGQAKDQTEAALMLRYRNDVLRSRRAGNLEIPRITDLPGYEKTKDALLSYVESAANRIAQVSVLGDKDVKALELINQIGNQGYDASAVKNLFDISVGAKKYGEYAETISRGARAFSTFTKLGLGALTNASQSVNTATVVGGMRTLLSTPKAAFSKEAKDFALEAGVTLDGVIRNLREGGGWAGKIGDIGAPGFSQVEKFNRVLAAYAGRDYARKMATQAAKGDKSGLDALQAMGLDASSIATRGKLTTQEEIRAARNIVERTQFKVDPQDLPGWASSPLGKVIAQFRTFAYNQTAFIGREIIQPALRGNAKPMIRFLVYGLPVGAAEVELQNFLRNRPSEEDPVQMIRQYYQRIGGIGVLGDVLAGLAPPNSSYLPGVRYALQAASLAAGPTIGTALEGIGSVPSALRGDPKDIERFILKQVPVVGPTAKNTFLPYKPGGRSGSGLSPLDAYMQRSGQQFPLSPMDKYLQDKAKQNQSPMDKYLNGGR